jgi:cytochrome c
MDTYAPAPLDIPLSLPADPILLQALLVVLFLLHILFVNLMVGGSLLAVVFELLGRRRPPYDRLARAVGATITVNKSLAVVLGVGPLLVINLLYTVFWYTANAHKYSWERLTGRRKTWHIALGAAGALLFLCVPLIFLANINLMLFPERWTEVAGFWSTLALANVLPRYLHFLLASVAVTALYLVIVLTRPGYPFAERLAGLERRSVRRLLYRIALGASAGQLLAGPLVLLTLPAAGRSTVLYLVVSLGAACALGAILLLARQAAARGPHVQTRLVAIVLLITATVFAMGYGRHLFRERAVADDRLAIARRTSDHRWAVAAAHWRAVTGTGLADVPLGERIFTGTCSACHALDRVLVGPPLREIAALYAGNPAGIAAWTANPGRKREGFQAMPAFKLGEEKLLAVAEYMLERGEGGGDDGDGSAAETGG